MPTSLVVRLVMFALAVAGGWAVTAFQTDAPAPEPSEKPSVTEHSPLIATASENKPGGKTDTTNTPDPSLKRIAPSDEAIRKQVVGVWEQQYSGRRVFAIREDGTGLMTIYPDGFLLRKTLGKKLEVDMKWSVEDGQVTLLSLGGRPKTKVTLALSMYGKERVKVFHELTETQMITGTAGADPDPTWTRIGDLEE